MFGIEYILVFVVAFSTGYDLGKDKKCKHKHIIVKHKPWYTLNVKHCLHKHNCKHKRKWKRHKRTLEMVNENNDIINGTLILEL